MARYGGNVRLQYAVDHVQESGGTRCLDQTPQSVVSRQGKGTFVAPKNTELAKEQAQKDIEDHIEKIVDIAKQFKIKKDDIKDLVDIFYGDDNYE